MFGGPSTTAIDERNTKIDAKNAKIEAANKRKRNRIASRNKKAAGKSSLISGGYQGIPDDENDKSKTLG